MKLKKYSKSDQPPGSAVGPKPFVVPELIGARGCSCLLEDQQGKNHLRYTGEVGILKNGTITTRLACRHGMYFTRYRKTNG